MSDIKSAILLFQLNNLQVYHYQTPEDIALNVAPYKVHWQDILSRHTYGPFATISAAMSHYTWLMVTQRTDAKGSLGNVIYVDFNKKKRVSASDFKQ